MGLSDYFRVGTSSLCITCSLLPSASITLWITFSFLDLTDANDILPRILPPSLPDVWTRLTRDRQTARES